MDSLRKNQKIRYKVRFHRAYEMFVSVNASFSSQCAQVLFKIWGQSKVRFMPPGMTQCQIQNTETYIYNQISTIIIYKDILFTYDIFTYICISFKIPAPCHSWSANLPYSTDCPLLLASLSAQYAKSFFYKFIDITRLHNKYLNKAANS